MRLQTRQSALWWHQIYHWRECRNLWALRYIGLTLAKHLTIFAETARIAPVLWVSCVFTVAPLSQLTEEFATWALNIEINETAGIIFLLKMLALGCIILANFVSFLNSIQDVQQVWSEWCLNLPITSFATGLAGFSFRSEDSTELCKFQPWNWHIKEFHVCLNEIFRCSKSCAVVLFSMTWAFSFLALL